MPLLFVLAVLIIYAPIVFTKFGTADDYVFLYRFIAVPGFGDNPFTNGRPISFFLTHIAFAVAGSLSGLSAIRLAGLVLYGLLAWRLHLLISSVRPLRSFSFWISLAIICLPSYQVVIPLAVDVSYPLAGILALVAVEIADSAFSKRRPWILCFSVLAVMLAFMIYQPMTMLYWSGVLLILFRNRRSISSLIFEYAKYLALFTASAVLVYFTLRSGGDLSDGRATFVQDIPGKVVWYFGPPLQQTFNLYYLVPTSTLLAIFVAVFVALGLWPFFRGDWRCRLMGWLICVSLIPLAYFPNLIIAENWAVYRTLVGMATLLLLYCFMAMRGIARLFRDLNWQITKRATTVVPPAVAIGVAILATYNMVTYYTSPLVLEIGYLRSELNRIYINDPSPQRLTIISPRWQDADQSAPKWVYDEFGSPASNYEPSIESMVRLLLIDLGEDRNIEVRIYTEPGIPESDDPTINMRLLRRWALPNKSP